VLQRYSTDLPFLSASPTEGGITSGVAARFLFGAAIVAVLLFEPGGLAGIARRVRRRVALLRTRGRRSPSEHAPALEPALRVAPTPVTDTSASNDAGTVPTTTSPARS
jgi:branched-chain amino acid transport system permease protein